MLCEFYKFTNSHFCLEVGLGEVWAWWLYLLLGTGCLPTGGHLEGPWGEAVTRDDASLVLVEAACWRHQ